MPMNEEETHAYVDRMGPLTFEELAAEMVRLASDLVETSKLNKPGIFHVTFVSALQRINVLSIVLNERAEDIETREGIQ